MLVSKVVRILTVYISPSRPVIDSDLSASLPVAMAGNLNAKHVDRNSRLITTRNRHLGDYTDKNSCLIYGPDRPTAIPDNCSATPDVLDIVITKDLVTPVYQTTCSALSSDNSPVLKNKPQYSSLSPVGAPRHHDRFSHSGNQCTVSLP